MNSKDPGLEPLNGMMLDLRHAAFKHLAQGSRVAEMVIAMLDASAEHLPAASGEPVAWQLPGTDSIITAKMKAYRGVLAETWTVPLYAAAQPAPALVPQDSPTAGMTIAQRILHVGGRNNAAGYVEFGSTQAVEALVRQVVRDMPKQAPIPVHELVTMYDESPTSDADMIAFARAIEAAHGIGTPAKEAS